MPRYRVHFEYQVTGVTEVEAADPETAIEQADVADPTEERMGDIEVVAVYIAEG